MESLGEALLYTNIREGYCLPIGNAKKNLSSDEFMHEEKIINNFCTGLNTLTVNWDGSVYSCCSPGGITPALYLGSIKILNLTQLINKFQSNIYSNILKTEGIEWFYNIINKNHLPIKLKNNYINLCDRCYTLFSNKDNFRTI